MDRVRCRARSAGVPPATARRKSCGVSAPFAFAVACLCLGHHEAAGAPGMTAEERYPVRWSRSYPGAVGHPMPLRGDKGVVGIVVTQADGAVVLVDGKGKTVWSARLDLPADSGAACGVLRPNRPPVVVATDVEGSVYHISHQGWRLRKVSRKSRSGGFRTPVIADLDGDGVREVIVTDSRGKLACHSAFGKPLFEITAGNYRVSAPAVCIQGDGTRHLIFGNDAGDVYRITSDGRLVWACRPGGRFGRSLPTIVQMPSGPAVLMPTSFVSSEPGLVMLDAATGALIGRAPSEVQSYQSAVVTGSDDPGMPAVLFGDKNSVLYALDDDGKRIWNTRLPGRGIFNAPAVLASGEGTLILQPVRGAGPDGRCLYALDGAGRIPDGISLPGGGGSSPVVCRFAGDKHLSLVTLSANGTLERRDLPAPWNAAKVIWAGPPETRIWSARASAHSATLVGPPTPCSAVLGTNIMAMNAPAGCAYAAVRTASKDLIETTLLRLADPITGAPMPATKRIALKTRGSMGENDVSVAWFGHEPNHQIGERRRLLIVNRDLSADGWQQVEFERTFGNVLPMASERRILLESILRSCRDEYERARKSATGTAFDALRAERERCLAFAHLARRAPAEAEIACVQVANPWKPLDAAEAARSRAPINEVHVDMLGNERESCAIAVGNLTLQPVTLRIERGPFTHGDGTDPPVPGHAVVRLHEPITVTPTSTGEPVDDPLPELGDASTFRLGPGEIRMLWLTISSVGLAAGEHTGILRIGNTASATPRADVRVAIRVSSVRLPDRLRYRHCNWLYPASLSDEAVRERVLKDALEHGTSVFVIPPPTVRLNAEGAVVSVDGAVHDSIARRLQGRAFFLISGAPALSWQPAPPDDIAAREAGFAAAVRAYGQHMRDLGWTSRDYALYLQDEPGLTGPNHEFEAFVTQVRRVKAADPDMPIYANPAGGATADMLETLKDLVDIWCPDMHLFRANPSTLEPIFRSGKEWWHYEAPGDQRNLSPLGFYRMQAWVAFRHGMQGAGYWVHSYDPYWFAEAGRASEYGSVYLTDGIPIATRRWEATRDGIEDFELLSMLRDAARHADNEWKATAERLLDEAVTFVTQNQERASDIGRQTEPFEPDYARWTEYRLSLIRMLETHTP